MMPSATLAPHIRDELLRFLRQNRGSELVSAYLFFLERKFNIHPVVYPKEKMIYQSRDVLIARLEKEGRLWSETEIKIGFQKESVNAKTKKIYICPFTGKVFGDNTHPNPQDAIYDWVSSCPENTERVGGLRVKRFFVSEDPEVIASYIQPKKESIKKVVYSSMLNGKLFNSKRAVIEDFEAHYLKPMTLLEVQSQKRFDIEPQFLQFLQSHLREEEITSFVEVLANDSDFLPYVQQWIEG